MIKRLRKVTLIKLATHWEVLLLGVFIAARVVYVVWFTNYPGYLDSDMRWYHERASSLALGEPIAFATYWPPAMHTLLGGLYWLAARVGLWEVRLELFILASSVLLVIAGWCLARLVKLFSESPKVYLATLLLVLTWFPWWYLNTQVLSENWAIPCLWIGIYFLIVKGRSVRWMLFSAFLLSIGVAIRPAFLFMLLPLGLWVMFKYGRVKSLLFGLTISLVLGVGLINTYWQSGGQVWGLGANGGAVFALSWCDLKSISYQNSQEWFGFGPPAAMQYSPQKALLTSVPFVNQSYYYSLGWDCIRNNGLGYSLALFGQNVLRLFDSQVFPRWYDIYYALDLIYVYKVWTVANLFFGVISFWLPSRYRWSQYLLLLWWGIFLTSVLAVVQGVGEERYLWPVQPLLLLLALPSYVFILSRLNTWHVYVARARLRKVINRLRLN